MTTGPGFIAGRDHRIKVLEGIGHDVWGGERERD